MYFITLPAGLWEQLGSIVMSRSVCVFVCPQGYLRNRTRDLYQFFVHVAYARGSVLLRQVDDRPHRLSAGREGVTDCSAQHGRSVICDCLFLYVLRVHHAMYDYDGVTASVSGLLEPSCPVVL